MYVHIYIYIYREREREREREIHVFMSRDEGAPWHDEQRIKQGRPP